MQKKIYALAVVAAGLTVSSCTPALNEEVACEEILDYVGEGSQTLSNMTENLDNPESLATFTSRFVEITEEVAELNIGNDELATAAVEWSAAAREFGLYYSDYESGDELGELEFINDDLIIATNTLSRLCE